MRARGAHVRRSRGLLRLARCTTLLWVFGGIAACSQGVRQRPPGPAPEYEPRPQTSWQPEETVDPLEAAIAEAAPPAPTTGDAGLPPADEPASTDAGETQLSVEPGASSGSNSFNDAQ